MTVHSLICFRRKVVGPKGGIKIDHCVELDGVTIFENGTRRQAQIRWDQERVRLNSEGDEVDFDVVSRDWYGKF